MLIKSNESNTGEFMQRTKTLPETHVLKRTQPSLRLVEEQLPSPNWKRAGLFRLVLAELIDRVLPLPFLAFFFPGWTLFVLAYHLLYDCGPNSRSVGKWVCRLRVVQINRVETCNWWRAPLQRFGIAASQAAWSLWLGIPFVLAYELGSLAFVLLSPTGQRAEEYLAGTLVVTEKAYKQITKRS
jgi:uncharacterized RDD family membrane protein YckC